MLLGDHCRIEYGINPNQAKSDQNLISIQNSIIMRNIINDESFSDSSSGDDSLIMSHN